MGQSPRPARRVAFATRHFDLSNRRVLDLGCGRGDHLRFFGQESVGLELNPTLVSEARDEGLDVRPWNFVEGIPPALGLFDAIWVSNLFEHVLAPHALLVDARSSLRPSGLLVAVVPLTRWFQRGAWGGYLAADHVNFFTRRTLRLTIERAGFDVRYLGCSSFPTTPRLLGRSIGWLSPSVMVVGSLVSQFQYPAKAHKTLDANGKVGFR